MQINLKSKQKK